MYKRSFKAFLQRCRACCIYLYKAKLFLPLESLYSDLHGKAAIKILAPLNINLK